ncbi:catalase [Streptomyces sp. H27-C3]|uniref:catalase n=1 Tax=Streptomyces sp. H27-C3 TaxID=3046305 RepID=UPI0024BB05DD|nr:catalase [Streptomyces sp. H27-C3]MDJ0463874.1 catalase [Streptomyces sp. H27-C3]
MNSDTRVEGPHLVEQLAAATGADPGQRLLHARGNWAEGEFTPSPQAAEISTAAVFAAPRTPVTARFSTTLGGSGGHDGDPGDQGLAIRAGDLDLVTFTLPVFFVRTGPDLIDFFRAVRSDDPAAFPAFLRGHPEAATALGFAERARPATSFTGVTYHAVHAFGLVDAAGATRWARLSLRPLRPLPSLDPAQALAMPGDYLTRDLADRLPAGFELTAQLPGPADELHDPTRLWTGTETTPLGTLTLTRPQAPSTEPPFDPLRLPQGITAPQDQLSKDRSTAYEAARRLRAA